jgi:lysozyme
MNEKSLSTIALAAAAVAILWYALRSKPARAISTDSTGQRPGALSLPSLLDWVPDMTTTNNNYPVRQVAATTLAFLRNVEGYSDKPYRDAGGYSVGYGHYLGTNPGSVGVITRQQAEDWLLQDATEAAKSVRRGVKVPLTQNQFDALVSFAYNLGGDDLLSSTLLKRLNAGDYAGAAAEFARWVYSEGKVNAGLVTRRNRERALFSSPTSGAVNA